MVVVGGAFFPTRERLSVPFLGSLFGSVERDSLIRAEGFLTALKTVRTEVYYEGRDRTGILGFHWSVSFGKTENVLVLGRHNELGYATVGITRVAHIRSNRWDIFMELNVDIEPLESRFYKPVGMGFRFRGDQTMSQNMLRFNREVFDVLDPIIKERYGRNG